MPAPSPFIRLAAAACLGLPAALAYAQPPGAPLSWPRLDGPARPECADALTIARAVFDSRASWQYEPQPVPKDVASVQVLQAYALDISGGGGVEADKGTFDELPLGEQPPRSMYWQKHPQGAYRLAIGETSYGWRGDLYNLYTVDKGLAPAAVIAGHNEDKPPAGVSVVVRHEWRPPQIYRRGADGPLWVLTVGQPFRFLDHWTVYVPEADGLQQACTIRFRPDVKAAIDLLPKPVRALEALLDRTMGSGMGEGTLHPTTRLRNEVEDAWANAAMRPWANIVPYNDRATVDAGLATWAEAEPSNGALLRAIRRQYPRAERSLAQYYRTRFHAAPDAARRQAAYLLDLVYRHHYAFPHGDAPTNVADANPWPQPRR
ncbi:hypothetical protein SAMN05428966_12023 [Massilia sp. PDC64]|nr:hypothetical protein [Massilia sp. PDC64]SDF73092.1 hypothetical protein SAMN05428966_12023 [Massilia sp. PDC64]